MRMRNGAMYFLWETHVFPKTFEICLIEFGLKVEVWAFINNVRIAKSTQNLITTPKNSYEDSNFFLKSTQK